MNISSSEQFDQDSQALPLFPDWCVASLSFELNDSHALTRFDDDMCILWIVLLISGFVVTFRVVPFVVIKSGQSSLGQNIFDHKQSDETYQM